MVLPTSELRLRGDRKIVVGDGVAFSYNLDRVSGTLKDGGESDMWVRVTDCYRKINGKWLIAREHVSVPVDLESGEAALDLKPEKARGQDEAADTASGRARQ